ncbi:MAG: hypothetical protein AAGJ82_04290, partial [Bacteroidota bacterium]
FSCILVRENKLIDTFKVLYVNRLKGVNPFLRTPYLNEPSTGGAIHKYAVNADGSLTEIGNPWFDNDAMMEELVSPHGVAIDVNGYLYIGEHFISGQQIRRLTCDGGLFPESEFGITTGGQFNLGTIGNNIFLNGRTGENIEAYDLCSGNFVSGVSFCETDFSNSTDWGFYIDPRTGVFYATSGFTGTTNYLWVFTLDDFDNNTGTCVTATALGPEFPSTNADVRGVTTDTDGNVYIAVQDDSNLTNSPSYILKFGPGPDYDYITRSDFDTAEDGTGFRRLIGLTYSPFSDRIYASTESSIDDCVSLFNTDLDYLGPVVPSPGTGDNGKGIALNTECCPTTANQTVELVVCTNGTRDSIFLNELFPCDAVVCEAQWSGVGAPSNAILRSCNQTVNTASDPGCYTFTRSSNGSGLKQCGAFTQTIHLEIIEVPDITVSGDQTIACGDPVSDLTATTTGTIVRWESNTATCQAADLWTAIPGTAGMTTFNPGSPNQTTHYRAIISGMSTGNGADCPGGDCELASNCVTVATDRICEVGFDLALTKVPASSTGVYRPGQMVSFDITVFNQGTVDAFDIDVTDYFGSNELTFSSFSNTPATGFSSGSPNAWDFTIDELAAGQQVTVTITFMINVNFIGNQIVNNAEVVDASASAGGPTAFDEDSQFSNTNDGSSNELGSDDDISDDSNGGADNANDQDDYDPAIIQICLAGCGTFPWGGN